jgi:hypothetical protein
MHSMVQPRSYTMPQQNVMHAQQLQTYTNTTHTLRPHKLQLVLQSQPPTKGYSQL